MHVIRVALEEFVQEHIERESFAIFQEQIIAFEIGFVIDPIHDHTESAPAIE